MSHASWARQGCLHSRLVRGGDSSQEKPGREALAEGTAQLDRLPPWHGPPTPLSRHSLCKVRLGDTLGTVLLGTGGGMPGTLPPTEPRFFLQRDTPQQLLSAGHRDQGALSGALGPGVSQWLGEAAPGIKVEH